MILKICEIDLYYISKNNNNFLNHLLQISYLLYLNIYLIFPDRYSIFLIYERNNSDNQNYSIHIVRKLDKYLKIEDKKFVINDLENYCCFWIYNKDQFHKFLRSEWWSFKKRAHNFRHNYGITERSSIGFHSFNMNYFKATLLPEIDNQPDPNCFIEHMTNNYYEKFSEFKNQNYMDIRGVCTLKINDIFEDLIEVKDNFFLVKLFKLLKWKFRFISRKFN